MSITRNLDGEPRFDNVVVRCRVSIPVVKTEQEPKQLKSVACQPRWGPRGGGRGLRFPRNIALEECRIENGMSGSPILRREGAVVGVISTGPINPPLATFLPAWMAPPAGTKRRLMMG